jgi:hypothetical protein
MSKALRGDFERLRGRGVATTLAPSDEQGAATASEVVEPAEFPEEPEPEGRMMEQEPVVEPAAPPPEEPQESVEDEPSTSWLSRMLGR